MLSDSEYIYDVLIVGAGAAGIGVAIALLDANIDNFAVLESEQVGASFASWPRETRFITPSFPTNSVGMLDLNSVAIGVSPGASLQVEHPTGFEFAQHLRAIVDHFGVPVREGVNVTGIVKDSGIFLVRTANSELQARHVIWAAGEFKYPRRLGFPGAELCLHTASIDSYDDIDGDDIIVIGGYESGVDAAFNLAFRDKLVRLFDRECPWESISTDPSIALSPISLERMREDWFVEQVELHPYSPVTAVQPHDQGFEVTVLDGKTFHTDVAPLWAGGFEGSHMRIANLFEMRPDGFPQLTESDESTLAPGLFFSGPIVRHDEQVFCFIYKFRQRFAVVAKAIADSLGMPADSLESYRTWGMYLDDLSCCGGECVC
ncbi:MAG: NAD(P)-binding domain-containing protein [Halieaceae bacterium]|nr:NAD(P)-binding domain-containing protein [Halieaceae bacterium]